MIFIKKNTKTIWERVQMEWFSWMSFLLVEMGIFTVEKKIKFKKGWRRNAFLFDFSLPYYEQ